MHSKVTIVVKKFHWYCISCRVVNKHLASIDEHLKVCHIDLLSFTSGASPCPSPEFEYSESSDGELDLCSQLNKNTDKDDLSGHSEDIPGLSPLQRKQGAQKDKESKADIVSTRNKGRAKQLSSNTSANILDAEPSQSKRTTKSLSKSSEPSERKCSTSAVIADTKAPQEVSFCLRKNSHSLSKLTSTRKRNQRQQLVSDSNSRSKRKSELNTTKHLLKQEFCPPTKRPRQKLDSKIAHLHEEDRCGLDDDKDGIKGTETSKKSLKSTTDKSNTDTEGEVHEKKARRGRPKGSGKKKTNFGKPMKAVDREMKRPGLGGKPVKRSLEISEQEMKSLKACYIGSQQTKNSNYEKLNTELVVAVAGKTDEMCFENSPHNCHREFAAENKIKMVKLTVNKLKHLTVAEKGCEQKTATESIRDLVGSGGCENGFQNLITDSTVANVTIPGTQGQHTDITESSSAETNVAGTYRSDTSYQHESICSYQSSGLFPLEECDEVIPAISHDFPCVGSDQYRENEHPSQILEVPHKNLHPPTHFTSVPSTVANSVQVLPNLEHTDSYTNDCRFQNSLQTDAMCSQQNVSSVTEIVEKDHSNVPEQCKTTECEEWMKSKTAFSFTKTKPEPAACFQQLSKIYECEVCEAKFSAAEYLSDHVLKMSSYPPAECQSCQRPFHSVYDINFHVFGDHEKRSKPFCFECKEKFQTMEVFEKHLHQHMYGQDPKLLDMEYHCCNICKLDIPCRYDTLRKHYYNKHKATICLECFVKSELVLFSDSTLLREHKKSHANFCNVCLQDFSSVKPSHTHNPYHTKYLLKEDGRGKLCERCNQWCPNRASAVLHHKEHKLQIMRNWRVEKWGVGIACVHCDKVLRNKRNLQRHIAQLHSSCRSYNFQCEFCGKGIDSRNILKDHIAVHHLGIKRYSCEFCDQRFACAPTLRRHILKEHATDRQYTCEECGERFCEKFKLTRHMYVHTGSARFMCEHCGKGFHSSSEFKKHKAVHAEKREFVCQGCGQEYKRNEHLKRHIQKCTRFVHINAQVDSGAF